MSLASTVKRLTAAGMATLALSNAAVASDRVHYSFTAAAQEIAQLFWLAETANACGWATQGETDRFEHFAVRFIAAHLDGTYQIAFLGMVGDGRYVEKVRSVALENTDDTCRASRWQQGWVTYKAAADANDGRY